jgi:MFS family permease
VVEQYDVDALPKVPSPYEGRVITRREHLQISAYWFATNFLWGALLVLMLPNQLRDLAPAYRVSAIGLLTGISAVVALVVPLLVGALSDRCTSRWGRRRPFMVVGVLINLLGLALMAVAYSTASPLQESAGHPIALLLSHPGYLLFLGAYMVVQLGNNVASAAYSGIIPDLVPENQRGAASGYMALMSQGGTLFGAVVVGVLLGAMPEWTKYSALGLVLAGVSAVSIAGIKENPMPHAPKLRWGPYIRSLWIDPRKYPDFAWVWVTRAMVMLGFYGIMPFINYYLVDVIGVADVNQTAPILMGIILVATSISGIYGGQLSDKVGRKRVVYVANASIAVMVLLFIFCRTFEQALIVGILFGIGYGAYISVDWALGTDVLPTKTNAAKEMAVWHVAMTLPQSLAPPVAAFLITSFGKTVETTATGEEIAHYTTNGYAAVFVMCSICFAVGAYWLRNVRGAR